MGRRVIRLKEYGPHLDFTTAPSSDYIAARGGTLEMKEYRVRTDENGFILSSSYIPSGKNIIGLGDSVLECLYVEESNRFCAQLESHIRVNTGKDINVLNGGYSGSTSLHILNNFTNKIVPLRPDAVFLMTGIMDLEAMFKVDSFWSKDGFLRSIVEDESAPGGWDQNFRQSMDAEARIKINRLIVSAASLFDIPLIFVSTPHQQDYLGSYICNTFPDQSVYLERVSNRREANGQIEQLCKSHDVPYVDIQSFPIGLDAMFYDDIHLTSQGAIHAAEACAENGFIDAVKRFGLS